MQEFMATRDRRITAGIMAVIMLFSLLFSVLFIAVEADHDCTGDDCPICACIQECGNTLRGFTRRTAVRISVVITVLFVLHIAVLFTEALSQETLVIRKVRLNN